MCKSQERLKTEVKLLVSANRKSYMLRRLAQQQMTLSDIQWPFHELLVIFAIWLLCSLVGLCLLIVFIVHIFTHGL